MIENAIEIFGVENPLVVGIELLVIWICVYGIFHFLRNTRGAGVIKGFALLLVVSTLLTWLLGQGREDAFTRLGYIYQKALTVLAVFLIVVFQPELRQGMVRLGNKWQWLRFKGRRHTPLLDIADAVRVLSENNYGALIAIERSVPLGELAESGVFINAPVNAKFLQYIFSERTPLHDLGVIIRGDRVLAAKVQFPLAEEGMIDPSFGSRHRAAVGLSVETDCLVLVVSEESGDIRLAVGGTLSTVLPDALEECLADELTTPDEDRTTRPDPDTDPPPVEQDELPVSDIAESH